MRVSLILILVGSLLVAACSPVKPASATTPGPETSVPTQSAPVQLSVDVTNEVAPIIAKYSPIHFYKDSVILLPGELAKINAMSQALKPYQNIHLRFRGHTANVYTPDLRFALSLARAESVRWLFEYRVGEAITSVDVEGLGSKELVSQGDSEAAMAPNRRVEILLQNAEK